MSEKQVAIMKMFTEIKEFLVKNIQGNKKDVALVLSSGGARGLAHIGAIEELEARGYHIKSIAGTSMGALVAGMYATGHLKEFREWMKTIDKQRIRELTDYSPSLDHLVRGNKVIVPKPQGINFGPVENVRQLCGHGGFKGVVSW